MNANVYITLGEQNGRPVIVNSKDMPHSCTPNVTLKPAFTNANGRTVYKMIVTRAIGIYSCSQLPFAKNFRESKRPLKCFEHRLDMSKCPFEKERRRQMEDGKNNGSK